MYYCSWSGGFPTRSCMHVLQSVMKVSCYLPKLFLAASMVIFQLILIVVSCHTISIFEQRNTEEVLESYTVGMSLYNLYSKQRRVQNVTQKEQLVQSFHWGIIAVFYFESVSLGCSWVYNRCYELGYFYNSWWGCQCYQWPHWDASNRQKSGQYYPKKIFLLSDLWDILTSACPWSGASLTLVCNYSQVAEEYVCQQPKLFHRPYGVVYLFVVYVNICCVVNSTGTNMR